MGKGTFSILTRSEAETVTVGRRLGVLLAPGAVVALTGPLGAGKTSLARGILRGLGVDGPVSSPSFVLVREYDGRLRAYHWDVYRLSGVGDLDHLPLHEHSGDDSVLLIEWADRVAQALPGDTLWINISRPDPDRPDERCIAFTGSGAARLLAEVAPCERSGD